MAAISKAEFTALMSRLLMKWGLSRAEAFVLAEMLYSGRTVNADELKALTGFARSTLSVALRRLEERGLVISGRRGRRTVYRAVPRLTELFKARAREILEREVVPLIEMIEKEPGEAARMLERDLKQLKEKLISLLTK